MKHFPENAIAVHGMAGAPAGSDPVFRPCISRARKYGF
jgi:hypothetical protein